MCNCDLLLNFPPFSFKWSFKIRARTINFLLFSERFNCKKQKLIYSRSFTSPTIVLFYLELNLRNKCNWNLFSWSPWTAHEFAYEVMHFRLFLSIFSILSRIIKARKFLGSVKLNFWGKICIYCRAGLVKPTYSYHASFTIDQTKAQEASFADTNSEDSERATIKGGRRVLSMFPGTINVITSKPRQKRKQQ